MQHISKPQTCTKQKQYIFVAQYILTLARVLSLTVQIVCAALVDEEHTHTKTGLFTVLKFAYTPFCDQNQVFDYEDFLSGH